MAEIKVIGNIERSEVVNRFDPSDINLVPTSNKKENFNVDTDNIESYVYDIGGNLLNIETNYTDYKLPNSHNLTTDGDLTYIEIDPIKDLQNIGFSSGEFRIYYNFFRNKVSDLFIKTISPNRTELSLSSINLTNSEIESIALSLINEIETYPNFKTYLLNFGLNKQEVVINVALNKASDVYEILIKLYKPLPEDIELKTTLSLIDEVIDPYIFDINLDQIQIEDPLPQLGEPNFSIKVENTNTVSTPYFNLNELNQNQSSYYQLLSFTNSQSIDINVDYSDPSNFSKFGSSYQRIINFYNKVKNIEEYNNIINSYYPYINTTSSLINEINKASSSISDIIANFDGFEYYLYFESSSYGNNTNLISTYPKASSLKPYQLLSTGSLTSINWYNNSIYTTEIYDKSNLDQLINTLPEYIVEDNENNPYLTFVNMIGHYFDNSWIYIKSVTDLYKAYNNQEIGVSKDLVYYSLQSLGLKLYNSKEGEYLENYIVGNNSGSSNFDDDFSITGSYINNIPRQELLSETFKRLYHNIPLLFKSKGTKKGYDLLNNIFGVSSSILEIKEFGGISKQNYLKGYNTSKTNIVSSSIKGNVLSSLKSLNNSSSSLSIDNHLVDISFSPQNQIDNVISSSIAVNYPTFNIDNFIGDPRNEFSSSFIDLKHTASILFSSSFDYSFDYDGFIRLIKYFDNSLFKTHEDFTPARNNITTGITFRSPQLEIIKIPHNKTTIENIEVLEAKIQGPYISSDTSSMWINLSGNRESYFNGELPGFYPNINNSFNTSNNNPYKQLSPIIQLPSVTGTNNYNFYDDDIFSKTGFNILLNNISGSRNSNTRKILEPIYGTNANLKLLGYSSSYYAELQDTYETLTSYNTSRYRGVKLIGVEYNKFNSGSIVYVGDKSYGKEPVINRNSWKFAWIKSISPKNINFYNKTTVSIRYLIDSKGSITNLSRENRNLFEVQNIFKQGTSASVALLNPVEPTNQVALNGLKPIWEGGFSYSPIIYRETNEILWFNYLNPTNVISRPLGIKAYQKDSISWTTSGNADKSFHEILSAPNNFSLNGVTQTSTALSLTYGQSIAWPYKPPITLNTTGPYKRYNGTLFNFSPSIENSTHNKYFILDYFLLNDSGSGYATTGFSGSIITEDSGEKYIYFKAPRQSEYNINLEIPIELGAIANDDSGASVIKVLALIEKRVPSSGGGWQLQYTTRMQAIQIPQGTGQGGGENGVDEFNSSIVTDGNLSSNYIVKCYLYNQGILLNTNDELRVRLVLAEIKQWFWRVKDLTFKIPATGQNPAYFEIYDKISSEASLVLSGSIESLPPVFTYNTSSNELIFNDSASLFYNTTIFAPQSPISSSYSPVIFPFSFERGDLVRFGTFFNASANYYKIDDIIEPVIGITGSNLYVSSSLKIKFDRLINFNDIKPTAFAILRKSPDETCVILNYNKSEGETTQGTLSSEDLRESITKEIANIISPIKDQLILDA